MSYSSVLVTFPTSKCAKDISRSAIENNLAACVNISDIESIYRWNDEIQESIEVAGLFKIRIEDFPEFCEFIRSRHPYEIPCIVRYDVAEGYGPYLHWIRESTNRY